MLLSQKKALVTGCNRGIGKAVLEVFARNGAEVIACARTRSDAFEAYVSDLRQRYGVKIVPLYFELADPSAVKNALGEIKDEIREIDVLINNAGIVGENRLFQMTGLESMKDVFDVNFFACMNLTQYISRTMIRNKRGSIVNMASIAGLDGDPGQVEYVASKAALIGATKKLALELGAHGVRVNAVAPGLTETDMAQSMTPAKMEETVGRIIMKRRAKPEEVANAALFLASDLSSYVTGQILRVDGGVL